MIKTQSQLLALAIFLCTSAHVSAKPIDFSDGWSEQRFSVFSSNEFEPSGETLHIRSNGTASMFWSRLPSALSDSTQAQWDWEVTASVPPTDLTLKGGDDRNLSVYFVFMPEGSLPKANAKLTAFLGNTRARVLMYAWGGKHMRGEILPTPYLNELGRTLILRPAGTGQASERVNLKTDFQRAFGTEPTHLIGIAISADSDDTDTKIRARVSNMRIGKAR
jgi:hypothetical protein